MSEIEPPVIIAPVTISPEITHEEIAKTVDESATNEINEINVNQHTQSTQPPSANEILLSENGFDRSSPEPSTSEMPPASILQRIFKSRRKGKKHHALEDKSIDEEFASRLDMSCADAETSAPQIDNAHVANYIRYGIFLILMQSKK